MNMIEDDIVGNLLSVLIPFFMFQRNEERKGDLHLWS